MPNRYYSSTAGAMTLSSGIAAGDTSIVVSSVAGLPTSYPYSLVLDAGTGSEEIVDVTAASGTTLTIARAKDSTSAQAHSSGATVRHMATARDLREPQEHMAASQNVHGLGASSSVVGTTDTQVIEGKTFQPASGANTPLTVKAAVGQSAVIFKTVDSSGAQQWSVDSSAAQLQSGAVTLRGIGSTNLFGEVIEVFVPSNRDAIVANHASGATSGYGLKVQKNSVDKMTVDLDGKIVTTQLTSSGPVSGTTGTFSGAVSGTTGTFSGQVQSNGANVALASDITSLDSRVDTLEAAETAGRTTVTTDASGNALVPHGLGVVPAMAIGTGEVAGSTPMIVDIFRAGTTSTNINFVCFKDDGTRWASTSVTINWIARR